MKFHIMIELPDSGAGILPSYTMAKLRIARDEIAMMAKVYDVKVISQLSG